MTRGMWQAALHDASVLDRLAAFDPHVAGTPPLGLDMPDSDIDVLCHARDLAGFADAVIDAFCTMPDFAIHQWMRNGQPVIARFTVGGWPVEIFGSTEPVAGQPGWRHFVVERRLLAIGGMVFRQSILAARRAGAKTEPAFAAVLALAGDPYAALLDLARQPDSALAEHLFAAGFIPEVAIQRDLG